MSRVPPLADTVILTMVRDLNLAVAALCFLLLLPPQKAPKVEAPIRLHPQNPHYFLWRNKAVVLIGSGEHYGAVLNGDFDFHKYLQTLEASGLNYTRLFAGSYVELPAKSFGIVRNDLAPAPGRFIAPWTRSSEDGYAGGGKKFDLTQWNSEYFSRLHDFLAEALRRGIVVEITLFSSQYGEPQWNLSPFKSGNNVNHTDPIEWKKLNTLQNGNILGYQELYVRHLVREANAYPNVIFEIANEPWSDRPVLADVINPYLFTGRDQYPNSVDLPDELTMAWQGRVAEWIRSEEAKLPNRHLLAQNCCNFRYAMRQPLAGVDILNFHYAYPEAVLLNYGLGTALSCDETGFLGRSDEGYVQQAWNFMMSGGSVFDMLDYSFSVGHEDGSDRDANGPGGGSADLRRRLRILSEFLQELPLVEMSPDTQIVKHAGGVVTHVLSNPKGESALYIDGKGLTQMNLALPPGEYTLKWVDTGTGASSTQGFRHTGGDKVIQTPEFRNGLALRIVRKQAAH
jgi:hypothetical protein